MSKTAKNGRKCGADLGEGIRGVWPEEWGLKERLQAPKIPWTPPKIPGLPPLADRDAFEMHSRGMKQQEIAAQQHRSQPTVSRGISAVETWLARTLPEDSGNLTGWERFRVGMVRHRIYLEHLKSRAEKEYERSCETLKIERVRTRTYPEGRKHGGELITETVTDVYPKHQLGRVSYLHFLDKVERELAELQAGWLGNGNINMGFDKAIDPQERDRWDRHVKWQEAQIAELKAKLAAAEAKGAEAKGALGAGPPSTVLGAGLPARAQHAYEIAEKCPDSGLKPPLVNDPTPVEKNTCAETAAPDLPRAQEAPKVNKTSSAPSKLGWVTKLAAAALRLGSAPANRTETPPSGQQTLTPLSQGEMEQEQTPDGMLPLVQEPAEDPRPRWEDEYRQEALDFHCLKHGLPPASLEQATGIPDPKKISPRMWIEKGYPYMIHIDRSIPCDRINPLDTGQVLRLAAPISAPYPRIRVHGWPRR